MRWLLCLLGLAIGASPASALVGGRGGYPLEWDARAWAICDGATDARAGLQAAIDAGTAVGATIIVPSGTTCAVGGTGLELKDKLRVRCEGGSGFKALSGLSNGIFYSTGTGVDDWQIEGCDLNLNSQAIGAVNLTGDGTRWRFAKNYVHGISTTSGSGIAMVRLDCTVIGGPCEVADNWIVGSGTTARDDVGLYVTPAGYAGLYQTQITGNYIDSSGGTCLQAAGGGGAHIADNVLSFCLDYCLRNGSMNSEVVNNVMAPDSNATDAMLVENQNMIIVGNKIQGGGAGYGIRAVAANANVAGLQIDENYLTGGVLLDSKGYCASGCSAGTSTTCESEADADGGTCGTGCPGTACVNYGTFDHDTLSANLTTTTFTIENGTGIVVANNTFLVTTATNYRSVRLTNNTPTTVNGGHQIANNNFAIKDTGSDGGCIEISDAGGGWSGITINGNYCGRNWHDGAGNTLSKGIVLPSSVSTWHGVDISGNSFDYVADAIVNLTTDADVAAGTILSGNTGLQPDDPQPTIVYRDNGTASLSQFSAVEPASGANDRVQQAAANSQAVVGCSQAVSPASGDDIPVAVGGVATCRVKADGGSYPNVTRGDRLAMSATAGKLRKADDKEPGVGIAQETSSADSSMRVLLVPTKPARKYFIGTIANMDASATRYTTLHGVSANITAETQNAFVLQGAIVATGMRCRLVTAPGAGKSRTITLRSAYADVSDLACTISDTATDCSDTGSTSLSDGSYIDWKWTYSGAPANTVGTCMLYYYSTDGVM